MGSSDQKRIPDGTKNTASTFFSNFLTVDERKTQPHAPTTSTDGRMFLQVESKESKNQRQRNFNAGRRRKPPPLLAI